MSHLYPFTDARAAEVDDAIIMAQGDGIEVIDTKGKRYIDAASGLWCAGLGFSNQALADAATRQINTLPFYHSFMGRGTVPTLELARQVTELAPDPLSHVFFSCSGSEAVDLAVKLVWYFNNAKGRPNKKRIISRLSGYHGSGMMSAALTGMSYCHDGFDVDGPMVIRTGRPSFALDAEPGETEIAFSKRRARELDAQIQAEDPGTIGAFIGEPVIGSGGAIMPPDGYWQEIQNVLARHDILLIADEIICGFGRTGEWFASQTYGIRPDLMTIAKQLSGAYMPISGTLISDDVYQMVADHSHALGTFGHGVTYGGHPVAAAVALEAINQYKTMDICARVKGLAPHLARVLQSLAQLPEVARVRWVGLMGAVDLQPDPTGDGHHGARVAKAAQDEGLLYRVVGDTIALSPPMIISEDELNEIGARLKRAIQRGNQPT